METHFTIFFRFDYGEKFWIIKWKQFTCTCGSVKCRYSKDTIHKTLEEYRARHEDEADITQDWTASQEMEWRLILVLFEHRLLKTL